MPKATWQGQLTFGLVSVPVSLYSGEKSTDLQFSLVDARDQAHIRYQRVNEETGEEVPWDQIQRAFEYSDGNYVMLEDLDFERAAPEASKMIEVDGFIDRDEIEPMYFEKPYFLVPRKGGEKTYVLLREALKGKDKIAIARVVIRARQYLFALVPEGDAIIANRMRFPQELRHSDEVDIPTRTLREYHVTATELDAAEKLVQAMSQPWNPDQYHDQYREMLMDWIQKKVRTGEGILNEEEEEPLLEEMGDQEDVLDLLERSLDEIQAG